MDDGERAFGVGAGDGCRQREVGPQPVVAARVVEIGVHAEESLPAAELERRVHRDGHGLVGSSRARALVSDRVRRPPVRSVDAHPRPHGAGLERGDLDRLGPLDDDVLGGRRVVVRVAAVAAVDEPPQPADSEAVARLDGVRLAVDPHREVLVLQRRRPGGHTRAGPVTLHGRVRAPAEAGDGVGGEDHVARGWHQHPEPERRALVAQAQQLVAQLLEIGGGLAAVDAVKLQLDGPVPGTLEVVAADARPRELGAAHHLEHPPHLLARHRGREAFAADRPHHLGRHRRAAGRHQVHRALAGHVPAHEPAPVGAGRVHHERGAGGGVDLDRHLVQRLADEHVPDLAGVVVSDEHLVDDLVVAARARRVVRAVEHEVPPRDVEERVRRAVRQKERRQGLCPPLDGALRGRACLVHVDPVRRHAHEHVGAHTRAQLTPPRREAVRRLFGHVLGQRGDDELVVVLDRVRLGHDAPEPRLRHLMVGPVHQQHRPAREASRPELELVAVGAGDELLGIVGEVAPVRVRAVEVLGAYP